MVIIIHYFNWTSSCSKIMFTQVTISIVEITSRYWWGSQLRIDVIPRLTKLLLYKSHSNIIWIWGNLQKYEERNNKSTLKVENSCWLLQVSKVYSAGMSPQWNHNHTEKNYSWDTSCALCYQKIESLPLHATSYYNVQFITSKPS